MLTYFLLSVDRPTSSFTLNTGYNTTKYCCDIVYYVLSIGLLLYLRVAKANTSMYACTQGEIMINGFRMDEDAQEYFVANTGYVSQQATRAPYYEELTVCENLTLAAEIKLNGLTREEKFERVNHVMKEV